MARRRRAQIRKIEADPIYGNDTISKFINKLMYDGKKSKAENIFYKAMDLVKDKLDAAIKACIDGASHEFDFETQKLLMRVKSLSVVHISFFSFSFFFLSR